MNINMLESLLSKIDSTHKISLLFEHYFSQFDITSFAFTYYDKYPTTKHKLRYEYASDALKPWHEYYLSSGFADSDQTLQSANQSVLPIHWNLTEQLQVAKTPLEIAIRKESMLFGLNKGISLPVHGPNEDFASLTLHQRTHEDCLDRNQEQLPTLFYSAFVYYQAIKRCLPVARHKINNLYNLTRREQDCLNLVYQQLSTEEIAQQINVTTRTVHYHLQNAAKKLGVSGKLLAAIKFHTIMVETLSK